MPQTVISHEAFTVEGPATHPNGQVVLTLHADLQEAFPGDDHDSWVQCVTFSIGTAGNLDDAETIRQRAAQKFGDMCDMLSERGVSVENREELLATIQGQVEEAVGQQA